MKKGLLVSEAASIFPVHSDTVRRWTRKGILPSKRTKQGYRVFQLEDLLRYKEERESLKQIYEPEK